MPNVYLFSNFFAALLFLVMFQVRANAQTSSNCSASATIITEDAISIYQLTDTTFNYATITNSFTDYEAGGYAVNKTNTPASMVTFNMVNVSTTGSESQAYYVSFPATITLSNGSNKNKLEIDTSLATNTQNESGLESVQIIARLNTANNLAEGLYTSQPFEVIINYN